MILINYLCPYCDQPMLGDEGTAFIESAPIILRCERCQSGVRYVQENTADSTEAVNVVLAREGLAAQRGWWEKDFTAVNHPKILRQLQEKIDRIGKPLATDSRGPIKRGRFNKS